LPEGRWIHPHVDKGAKLEKSYHLDREAQSATQIKAR
jgi:hypothetical protein